HLGQKLADHPLCHVGIARAASTNRGHRIDLVKEDYAWRCLPRLAKDLSNRLLRFSYELVEQLRTLNADKVRLALVRGSLRQESLSSSRRTIQEQSLRGNGVHLGEEFRIFQRPLYSFPKLLLHTLQPANVLPFDIRNLHQNLSHRRRFHLLQCFLEVAHSDNDLVEDLHWNVLSFQVDLRQNPTKRTDSRFLCKRLQVGANKPVGNVGQLLQVHIFSQRHAPSVNLENLSKPLLTLPVELAHYLRPTNTVEICIRLASHRLRQQRFSSAWWPVKKDPLRSLDPQPLKQLRMPQGKFYHLTDFLDYGPEA